ncbi:MAG: response regulator [Lentisphaeraceae bacterium]|nr:response regulator [Lentisphaeraceae bacterium]
MSKEILTTNEAADLLGIARTSLINWVERGELAPATTPGGHRRFRRIELLAFAEKRGFDVNEVIGKRGKASKDPERAKVLVVDDDEDFRQFAQDCLSIAGDFDVKESTNGIDAALIVGSWRPSIVLLDLRMPKMNGFEFCRQMRSNDDFKDVKIIIMTAYADEETKKEIEEVEADDLICKPIGIKAFVEKLREVLNA